MFARRVSVLFAAALLVAPAAMAQQNNPAGNMGSNRSTTATPGTADSHAASGVNSADTKGASNYGGTGTSSRSHGSASTPGNNSTVAGSTPGRGQQVTGTGSGGGTTR